MATILFANNATSTLAGAISNTSTTANLAAGTGVKFPAPAADQYFLLTLADAAGLTNEIVRVTNLTGDVVTIIRGQEGTAAAAWPANSIAANLWTAGSAAAMLQQGQYQSQASNYAADTGTANAIVVALNPAITSLASMTGSPIRVKKMAAANSSSSITFTVNGFATTLLNPDGTSIPIGALTAGMLMEIFYDGTTAKLLSAQANVSQVFTGTTGLSSGLTNFPNGGKWDTNGQITAYGLQNLGINFLNPANSVITTENNAGAAAQFCYNGTSSLIAVASSRVQSTNAVMYGFFYQGTNVGNITTNGASTTYGTTSDETFKVFIGVYDPAKAMAIIRADRTRDFHWTEEYGGAYAVGWGAQTSYEVSKDLATPGGWFKPPLFSAAVPPLYGEDGEELEPAIPAVEIDPGGPCEAGTPGAVYRPWSLDQSKRTPYLWAVIPYLEDRIAELEESNTAQGSLIAALAARLDILEAK